MSYRLFGKKLYQRIAKRAGVTLPEVLNVLTAFRAVIAEGLRSTRRIVLPGFLTFEASNTKGYTINDPRAGEKVESPPMKKIYVRLHKKLKEYIRGEKDELPLLYTGHIRRVEDLIETEYKTIKSQRLAGYLMQRGFVLLKLLYQPQINKNFFLFKYSEELEEAITKWIEENEKA